MTWYIICQQVTNYKEDKPLKTQYFHFYFIFLFLQHYSFNLLSQLNSQVVKCIYFLIDS